MVFFWLCVMVILGFFEAVTINLVSIWFIISAFIALILSVFIDSFVVCFGVFVVVGTILLFTTRSWLESKLVRKEKTNLDRVVGMRGVITEDVSSDVVGEVKVDGKRWSCVSDEVLPKGSVVRILKINGVKLKVESWEE